MLFTVTNGIRRSDTQNSQVAKSISDSVVEYKQLPRSSVATYPRNTPQSPKNTIILPTFPNPPYLKFRISTLQFQNLIIQHGR
jgi:hypothetical protein